MISTGLQNLLKLVGGWMLAMGAIAFTVVYFDDIRSTLGMKLEPSDFGVVAEAPNSANPPGAAAGFGTRTASAEQDPPLQRRPVSSYGPSVELLRQRDGHFHADAYINGRLVPVLVDTGATLVALSYDDARAAGITVTDSEFTHWSQTANGRARFAPVTLHDVRIGDVVVYNVQAAVSEPGRLSKTLLGMSFIGKTRMQMQDGRLLLEQ